jgi:Asp-tRNA(Asn)/Glu-tRNA(Gln) amidotransferase A subunit family amidase
MLGISAEELENIAFEPGKSKLLPPEREKLDKLSEALSSKKMLILKVAGSYDDSRDLIAMKTARLYEEALLKLEDDTIDLSLMDRDELDDLFKEMYVSHFGEESLDLKEEKVKKLDMDAAAKKSELRRQIKDALIDTQKVSAADLVQLGQKRAQTIVSHLVSKGIDPTRLEVPSSVKSGSTGKENEYIPTKLELGAR